MVSYPSFSLRSPSFLFLKPSFFSSLFFCLFCHPITFSLAVRNTLNNGHCVSRDLFSTCSTTTPYLLSKSFISPTVQSRDNVWCPALSARSGVCSLHNKRPEARIEDGETERANPAHSPKYCVFDGSEKPSECSQLLLLLFPPLRRLSPRQGSLKQ